MVLSSIVVITVVVIAYNNTKATGNDPGSMQDPLVTKSYVDEQIKKMLSDVDISDGNNKYDDNSSDVTNDPIDMTDVYNYIDNKFNEVESSKGLGFVVVQMEAGQSLICEESTELIVRSGEASAVGNLLGDGISDVTGGVDIATGTVVPTNHLIIIPRTDGRGIMTSTMCYIMVKGKYTIS
jgi:hypothetical protein